MLTFENKTKQQRRKKKKKVERESLESEKTGFEWNENEVI